MESALTNILIILQNEFYLPVYNCFENSSLINNFLTIINKILNAIFNIFHSENIIEITNSDIATLLTILLFIISILFIVKLFMMIINFITDTFIDMTPEKKRFKTGGHKKKKTR